MSTKKQWQFDDDAQISVEDDQSTSPPKMYKVYLINDDYTPMDFVIWVLQNFFHKDLEEATKLMLDVHHKGRGLCGIFTYDVANTKVFQVKNAAKKEGHPLECTLEEE